MAFAEMKELFLALRLTALGPMGEFWSICAGRFQIVVERLCTTLAITLVCVTFQWHVRDYRKLVELVVFPCEWFLILGTFIARSDGRSLLRVDQASALPLSFPSPRSRTIQERRHPPLRTRSVLSTFTYFGLRGSVNIWRISSSGSMPLYSMSWM